MLQYERIDVSEGTGLDKTNKSKECEVYLVKQTIYFNNGITAFGLKIFAATNVKGFGYRIFMFGMTKNNAHYILVILNLVKL